MSNRYYEISGMDNDTLAYDGRTDVRFCSACRGVIDKTQESLDGVRISRLRKADISNTYDGVTAVSERFKQVCEGAGMTGVIFKQFPDDPGFYQLWTDEVVAFDSDAASARIGQICPVCGNPKEINTSMTRLKPGSVVPPNGLVRTDFWFGGIGGYDERCPILLCGNDAAGVLKSARLKGLNLYDC